MSETDVGGTKKTVSVGAMIGARGCLIRAEPPTTGSMADVFVVVVWQGMSDGTDPVAGSPAALCASGVDFGAGRRRGVSLRVMVPALTNS
jgi:type IV pilus assembly protein PilV